MKISKRQPILKWMKNNVKAKHHGNCFFYAATLALLFPQLKLVKGPPPHKGKGKYKDDTAHFWTEDKSGDIYDPTASQLEKDYEYKGKIVNPKKNIDFVIKDKLFKKLPKENQEKIEKILSKISKRATFHGSKEELKEIQKDFGDLANRLGAWDIHMKHMGNMRALTATANFAKELKEEGDSDNNFVASFLAMLPSTGYHVGYVMWPTLLGDFGLNPDINGNTNRYVLKFSGPNIGFDKVMKAVDIIGVFAETRGQITPIGSVYNPDLTELFPPELFQTWTKVSYSRYFIRAQRGNTAAFLAEANGKYCTAHFESPYIEERVDAIGSYNLFKEEEAPKIANYMKIIQSAPVFSHEERLDTDEFWDGLEEPECTYEEPDDHYEEANNQMFSISKRASTMSAEDFTKVMLIDVLSSNQVDDVHSPGSTMADIVVGLESLGYEDVAREISNSKSNSQEQRIALLKAGVHLNISGISQLLKTKPEWTPNGWVIEGGLDVSELGLTTLKYLNIYEVGGSFSCSVNSLTTLQGAPQKRVGGGFDCSSNKLTTLQGAPQRVGGSFWCDNNQLTTLQGAPQEVGGDFFCYDNSLTSLQGAPQKVGGNFSCSNNSLTSLQGAPQKRVGGGFDCSNNQLTTLQGAPQEVGGDFFCYDNSLTTLQGAPQKVGGNFCCYYNSLTTLQGAPQEVGGSFYCHNNPLDEEKTKESQNRFSISKKASKYVEKKKEASYFSISKRASTMSTEDFTKAMLLDVLSSNQVDDVHSPGSTMADIVVGLENLGYKSVAREISNSKPNSQEQRIALLKAGQLLDISGISQLLETKPEWTPNGWVIEGNLNISGLGLTTLKYLNIYEVGGSFYCSSNKLTTLQGAPQKVGGSFYCSSNKLTTLQGAPQKVGGNFDCSNNSLTSLQGAPQKVGSGFWCSYNSLTTLQGAPQKVGGGFWCYNNSLTTLQGAPQEVGGGFFCSNNPLNEEKTKESQSFFSISKRAQIIDLRELFPPSVFAGFTQNKSPWFITKYRPDKVQAFLRVDNSVIRFNARYFSRSKRKKFYFSLRWPKEFNPMGKEDLQSQYSSFLTTDIEEAKDRAEQFAGIIGEFTLQKEQTKPAAGPKLRIKQDFPPEIFAGWDDVEWRPDNSLSASSDKLKISLSVLPVRDLDTRELSHYNIFFRFPNQSSSNYNVEPDLLGAPFEKGDSVIQVIKNIGRKAQDIELSASIKLSKRATYEHLIEERPEEETQAADLLKEHFPYIPPEIFGGWRIFAYTPEILKGHELNNVYQFNAKLIVGGKELAEFVIVKNFFPSKPPRSFLVLEWDASLGDFNTGLIGNPVVWEITNEEEIMENLPKVLDIIERIGVEAESQTYLKQRNMEFAPKSEGNLPNIDLTKIVPRELLFGVIHSYEPYLIDFEEGKFDFTMLVGRGHINLNVSLRRGAVDDALSKYIVPGPPETPDAHVVVWKDIESVSKLNELIEPIRNTLKNMKTLANQKQASFQLSRRASKNITKYVQRKYFPKFPLNALAGWDTIEVNYNTPLDVGPGPWLLGVSLNAIAHFPKQNDIADAWFCLKDIKYHQNAIVMWPTQLGDLNVGASRSSVSNKYSKNYMYPEELKEMIYVLDTIGGFAESMRLAEESGRPTDKIVPIGKAYDPDLTKIFPKEMFYGWEPVPFYKKTEMKMMVPGKDLPLFMAEARGDIRVEIIYRNEEVFIPPSLRDYVKKTKFATIIKIKKYDFKEIEALAPAIKELINNIKKDLTKPEKEANMKLSKRASIDLREYFPLATFAGMAKEKTDWFIDNYEPNFIRASLNFNDFQIKFVASKTKHNFNIQLGNPLDKNRKSWWQISKEEFEKALPEIHRNIAEYTLMKEEEGEPEYQINKDFPSDLFKGWSFYSPSQNDIKAAIKMETTIIIRNIGNNKYHIIFLGSQKLPIEGNTIETPEDLEKIQNFIRELGNKAQKINLEANMRLSKRASEIANDFPPEVFMGWREVDYEENRISAESGHDEIRRADIFRSRMGDFYWMEIFDYEGNVIQDFRAPTKDPSYIIDVIKNIGSQTESSSPPYINKEASQNAYLHMWSKIPERERYSLLPNWPQMTARQIAEHFSSSGRMWDLQEKAKEYGYEGPDVMDFTPSGQEGIEKFVPKMKDISRLTHIKSDEELLNDWKRLPEATKNKLIPNWKNMMIFQILKELKKL